MLLPPNNIASLFSGKPAGPSQDVHYRQGTIITFNPITLENTVLVGDSVLTNLPLLGVGEATLLVTGARVGVIVVGDDQRGKTMAILGRFVVPNTSDAENAISLLSSQVYADIVIPGVTIPNGTALNNTGFSPPSVTIPIGPSGRVLVMISADYFVNTASILNPVFNPFISVEFTGANVISPFTALDSLKASFFLSEQNAGAVNQQIGSSGSMTAVAVFNGLNTGTTTITMRAQNAFINYDLSRRTVVAIRL